MPPSSPFLFLDTAGSNSPVFDTTEEHLAQRKNTEQLLEEIALDMADVIVLVVMELTWLDQQYIECLRERIRPPPEAPYRP